MLLSIAVSPDGNVIHLHADAEGLLSLEREIRRIRELAERGECEDGHFFSPAWGGNDLSETMLSDEAEGGWSQVDHLKLFGWTPEWSEKHGLSSPAP